MNRRNFLATTAAAANITLPVGAGQRADRFGPAQFHLGAVTYNVFKDYDLDTIIRMLTEADFEGVELRTEHKHGIEPSIGAAEREQVRKKFEQSKVKLVSYGTTCEFHSPEPAVRKQQVEIGKGFVDLARDTGAIGIKVRPNGIPKQVPEQVTVENIAASLRELGDHAAQKGISVWMEVHGRDSNRPSFCAAIMKAANHPKVGVCWNSNQEDIVEGSVKPSFDLLKPWIRHVHINELADKRYPWAELFTLLKQAKYQGYTLAEVQESKEPERFLRWYNALWTQLHRSCERSS